MNRFEQTSIWQKTLGKQLEPDIHEKERNLLRTEFENFRDRAAVLAAEIASVLPDFTVHDITHIDALWGNAELIAEDFDLTPTEAFVLGGAFLTHDLGMGLASFPNGVDELKKEIIWKDTVASLLREKHGRKIKEEDFLNLDSDTEKHALENVLRLLHAKHAEKLALVSWTTNDNHTVFLIENTHLRESYGKIIGLIAHSHWWSVEELGDRFTSILGAPGIFPPDWTVDPIKLACILRIADATQIDDRRAPSFLRTIRKPSSNSDLHWNFQQKLYQPRLERGRLVYTSKSSFPINEVDSWWLCHDTLKMIDYELKSVDALLADTNRPRLNAVGVASIEDPKRLAKLIDTEGWQPVDTQIKVTNVAKLAITLGGEQLYGHDMLVPLRELIQNASDAIRARRTCEDEKEEFGDIIIRFGEDQFGKFIEVEDNGVGMSSKVLTGPFLDFGKSFWGTSLMHEELPGLEAKGFKSTGKYGIGFYSVFMWGKKISITSRQYEQGRDSTLVLEFNQGTSSRPILRKALDQEVIKNGGTKVRVWLSSDQILEELLNPREMGGDNISTAELIGMLCPSIDCNVSVVEKSETKKIIHANDWLIIPPIDLIKRIISKSIYDKFSKGAQKTIEKVSKNMSQIEENGIVVGRAFVYQNDMFDDEHWYNLRGVVTIGGLKASKSNGIIGILIGESNRASREIGIPIISKENFRIWVSQQADLLANLSLGQSTEMACASIVRCCGADTVSLKIISNNKKSLSYEGLKSFIQLNNFENYFLLNEYTLWGYKLNKKFKVILFDNVLVVNTLGYSVLLQSGRSASDWPEFDQVKEKWHKDFDLGSLEWLILNAFSEVWGCSIKELINSSKKLPEAVVGALNDQELTMPQIIFINKPKKK